MKHRNNESKFLFKETFFLMRMRNNFFFIFDRLYLMAHVSSGNGKGVILALSYSVNNFVQEELFIRRFLLYREILGKNPETPGATSILQISVGTISKVHSIALAEFYYNSGLQRPHTRTCTILQETINTFFGPLILFFIKVKRIN